MIAESIISLLPIIIGYASTLLRHHRQRSSRSKVFRASSPSERDGDDVGGSRSLGAGGEDYYDPADPEDEEDPEHEPPERLVPSIWVWYGLGGSGVLGVVLVWMVFGKDGIHPWATAVGLVLASALSLIGVRALGETDLNPVSLVMRVRDSRLINRSLASGKSASCSLRFCSRAMSWQTSLRAEWRK